MGARVRQADQQVRPMKRLVPHVGQMVKLDPAVDPTPIRGPRPATRIELVGRVLEAVVPALTLVDGHRDQSVML